MNKFSLEVRHLIHSKLYSKLHCVLATFNIFVKMFAFEGWKLENVWDPILLHFHGNYILSIKYNDENDSLSNRFFSLASD